MSRLRAQNVSAFSSPRHRSSKRSAARRDRCSSPTRSAAISKSPPLCEASDAGLSSRLGWRAFEHHEGGERPNPNLRSGLTKNDPSSRAVELSPVIADAPVRIVLLLFAVGFLFPLGQALAAADGR